MSFPIIKIHIWRGFVKFSTLNLRSLSVNVNSVYVECTFTDSERRILQYPKNYMSIGFRKEIGWFGFWSKKSFLYLRGDLLARVGYGIRKARQR